MSPERFVKGESERTAKFMLIRLPLLTGHLSICAHFAPKLTAVTTVDFGLPVQGARV
jgi:hypothetical protein